MKGIALAAAASIVAGMAGCSLLVDTDSLSGVTPAVDGGSDAGFIAEASVSDTGSSTDGPDSSSSPFCGPNELLCETFDEGIDPLSRYRAITDPSTSITLDSSKALSAPRSAKFVINPSANTSPDATLEYTINGTINPSFIFEANVFIEREEPDMFARMLRINIDGRGPLYFERNGSFKIDSTEVANLGRLAIGVWIHLRLEVHPSTMTISAESIDGSYKGMSGPINASWTPGPIFLRFGVSEANSPSSGWIVYWDNIAVRPL